MKNPSKRSLFGIVFLTVFLDVVGFSILFPLFPALLDHYLGLEGEQSLIGRLVGFLSEISDGDRDAVEALFGGVLGSLYAVLQFLFAPVWGGLSDRIGRRPTLLFTLAGTAAAYGLWVFAGSFTLLIVSRLISGAMAGNISTASAVIADSTSGKERAGGMGMLGMGIGLGFILGPALGGLFGPSAAEMGVPSDWTSGFAMQPFSTCAMVALGLAIVNLFFVAAKLPETLPEEKRGGHASARGFAAVLALREFDSPGVSRASYVYFLFLTAFSAAEFTLTFLAVQRLEFEISDIAWMFVFVGLVIAFVQGGMVRRMAPRMGEKKLILSGLFVIVPAFLLIASAESSGKLYTGLFFMAVGSAFAMPCLSSLVSRYAPPERQGLAQGTFRSLGSLSRAVGPFLGGALFWQLGSGAPFYVGAGLVVIPLLMALGLPEPPESAEAASGH